MFMNTAGDGNKIKRYISYVGMDIERQLCLHRAAVHFHRSVAHGLDRLFMLCISYVLTEL